MVHGSCCHSVEVSTLWLPKGETRVYGGVGLWADGRWRGNLVLAGVFGLEASGVRSVQWN
jgi:hypothetical protein